MTKPAPLCDAEVEYNETEDKLPCAEYISFILLLCILLFQLVDTIIYFILYCPACIIDSGPVFFKVCSI